MLKKLFKPAAIFFLLFAHSAEAKSVLVYEARLERGDVLHPSFLVNLEKGKAGVDVRIIHAGDDEEFWDSVAVEIPGMTFDPATREIRYEGVVCAHFEEKTLGFIRWESIQPTERCTFSRSQRTVRVDGGLRGDYELTLTSIVMNIPDIVD